MQTAAAVTPAGATVLARRLRHAVRQLYERRAPMPQHSLGRTVRRNRDRIGRIGGPAAVILGVVGFVALSYLGDEPGQTDLTVIAVEPREAGRDLLAADATAQLDRAAERETDVLLIDAAETAAYRTSLACPPDATDFTCDKQQEEARSKADAELEELFDNNADSGDVFAVLRRTAEQLQADPVNGDVEVILNVTGRHPDPELDLTGSDLPDRFDELTHLVADRQLMPESCKGWQVHLVAPATGSPRVSRAREQALERVLADCGGELVQSRRRWVADGREFPPLQQTATAADARPGQVTFELDQALFCTDCARLQPAAEAVIDEITTTIDDHRDAGHTVSVRVDGYADHTGSKGHNQRLSEQRAQEVAETILGRTGLPHGAMDVRGHGELDGQGDGVPQHRRVDVTVVAEAP